MTHLQILQNVALLCGLAFSLLGALLRRAFKGEYYRFGTFVLWLGVGLMLLGLLVPSVIRVFTTVWNTMAG